MPRSLHYVVNTVCLWRARGCRFDQSRWPRCCGIAKIYASANEWPRIYFCVSSRVCDLGEMMIKLYAFLIKRTVILRYRALLAVFCSVLCEDAFSMIGVQSFVKTGQRPRRHAAVKNAVYTRVLCGKSHRIIVGKNAHEYLWVKRMRKLGA